MCKEFLNHRFKMKGEGSSSQFAFHKPHELLSFLEVEIFDIEIRLFVENVLFGSALIPIHLKKPEVLQRIRRTRS